MSDEAVAEAAVAEGAAGADPVADGAQALPMTRTADDTANADAVKAAESRLAAKGLLGDGSREPGERGEAESTPKNIGAAEAPKLTQRQREMAKQMGLDESDLKALGSKAAKTLDNWATKFDRTFSDLGAKSKELDEAIKVAKTGKVEAAADGGDDGLAGDDAVGDETPPARSKAKLAGVQASQFVDEYGDLDTAKVAQWSQNVESLLTDILHERESDHWDRFYAGLDPQAYPQFFDGDGNHADLEEGSPAKLAQDKFKEDVAIHLRGAAFAKKSITLRQAQRRLLPAPDPETIKRAEQDRISTDLKRQARMGIMRPRGQSGGAPALTEEERRVAQAEANLKRKGLIPA